MFFKMLEKKDDPYSISGYHKIKLKNRKRNIDIDSDRLSLAIKKSRLLNDEGKSVLDIMEGDPYWEYVLEKDEDYAKEVIKMTSEKTKKETELPPIKKKNQQPEGGEGGMFGSINKNIKISSSKSKNFIFLKRDKQRYMLFGTLVSRILSGNQEYLDEEGLPNILNITSNSAFVSRVGPAAKMAMRVQEEMPLAVKKTISKFLLSCNIENPVSLSKSIVYSYIKNRKFDIIPFVMKISNISTGFLLKENVNGIEEPYLCKELKVEIGKTMYPYINDLISALVFEGIDCRSIEVVPQSCSKDFQDKIEEISDNEPIILEENNIQDSFSVPSLLITMTSENSDIKLRKSSSDRLCLIMCKYPKVYDKHKLSKTEVYKVIENKPELSRFGKFALLFVSKDEDLIEHYFKSNGEDKLLISHIVSSQDRKSILDSIPEMCMQHTDKGIILNDFFLDKSDLKIPHVMSFFRKLVDDLNGGKNIVSLDKVLMRKMMQALYENKKDKEFLLKTLESSRKRDEKNLEYLSIILLFESENTDTAIKEILKIKNVSFSKWQEVFLFMSIFDNVTNEEILRSMIKTLKITPMQLEENGDIESALKIMKLTRTDPYGNAIPEAYGITSITDDPLNLATCLNIMEDVQSMLILLRECSLSAKEKDEDLFYPMVYITDSLYKMGMEDQVGIIFKENNIDIDYENRLITKKVT